jgi:hypothetical protein
MSVRIQSLLAVALLSVSIAQGDDDSSESKAIAEIEKLGGSATADFVSFHENRRFSDRHAPLLRPFTQLTKLNLTGTRITDAGLKKSERSD